MAELLIRVKDSYLKGDPVFDSKASRRGDVIMVQEDGWGWGEGELTHDFWRILKFPGVPVSQFSMFLSPEPEKDPNNPSNTLRFRMNKFDVDNPILPPECKAYIADDKRDVADFTASFIKPTATNVGDIAIDTIKVTKAAIADPTLGVLEDIIVP